MCHQLLSAQKENTFLFYMPELLNHHYEECLSNSYFITLLQWHNCVWWNELWMRFTPPLIPCITTEGKQAAWHFWRSTRRTLTCIHCHTTSYFPGRASSQDEERFHKLNLCALCNYIYFLVLGCYAWLQLPFIWNWRLRVLFFSPYCLGKCRNARQNKIDNTDWISEVTEFSMKF